MAPSPRSQLGAQGERIAAAYLSGRGHVVLAANYRTRYGEVDLVTRSGDSIVFVEVRTRRSLSFGTPEESVTDRKRARLVAAAQQYLQDHGLEHLPWRIDLVAILARGGGTKVTHHLDIVTEQPRRDPHLGG